MSSLSEKINQTFKAILPSPLTIALLLTILTFILALFIGVNENQPLIERVIDLATFWEKGLWGMDFINHKWIRSWQLPFLVQMMLMLALGYILAMSKPFHYLINNLSKYCTTSAKAALIISFFTISLSFINWGLGLIFGAIFARKVAEYATSHQLKMNYGLIGAAGYSGMMVWHGGLSGSAPIKAAEPNALSKLLPENDLLVSEIALDQTVFSSMNILVSLTLLISIPLLLFLLGKKFKGQLLDIQSSTSFRVNTHQPIGAEKIDQSLIFTKVLGGLILIYAIYIGFVKPESFSLAFLTPDYINLLLLSCAFIFHKNILAFLNSLEQAIGSTSGILIQFPFYFGILGIMKYSGLMTEMSDFFVNISNQTTFSLNTLFSAGIVNIFVPSGGGQWAVQGPIILQAAQEMNLPLSKSIMAIAYGDQLTNMLQPFWALPLLGITGLKPKTLLPFTLMLMLLGLIIFILGLLLF